MLIEITYNVTDVYMSTTETPIYVEISFEQPGGSSAVWGAITGTLSNQTDLQNALNAKLDENTIDGGTEGQILSKASATDFDFAWINNYAKYLATNVRNQTGSTINAFQVVYISGATGNKPLISLADADTEATSSKTYGVTATSIANNGTGDVVTSGELSGINTSAFNEGDLLWLSTTAGGVVTSPPAEPAHAVFIGYVVRSHPTLGVIDVAIANGYELNELHGVQITSAANNDGLFYNSSNSLWENKSIATVLGYTPEQPLTFNSPLSRAGNVVSIPQATGSVNGFLSATDWTTFNSKQAALGYTPANAATTLTINGVTFDLSANRTWTISTGISGSGASGQVTYWTGASAVSGSSLFTWDNTGRILQLSGADMTQIINQTNTTLASAIGFRENGSTKGYIQYVGSAFSIANRQQLLEIQGNAGLAFRTGAEAARFFSNGNLAINSTSDLGVRLGVLGDTLLRGSGNTSATTALTVQNSSSTNLLNILNDGKIGIGTNAPAADLHINSTFATSSFQITRNGVFASDASFNITNGTGQAGQFLPSFIASSNYVSGAVTEGLYFTARINNNNSGDRGVIFDARTKAGAAMTQGWIASFDTFGDSRMRISHNGNMVLQNGGAFTDNGQRLQVIGDTLLRGSGANVLRVQNSGGSDALIVTSSLLVQIQQDLQLNNTVIYWNGGNQIRNTSNGVLRICDSTAANFTRLQFGGTTTAFPALQRSGVALCVVDGTGTGLSNLIVGGTSDSGNKFQVYGDTLLRGSGATSATTALTVQNSFSTNLFTVRNDGAVTTFGDFSVSGNYIRAGVFEGTRHESVLGWGISFTNANNGGANIFHQTFASQAPNGNVNGLSLSYRFGGATSTFTNNSILINNTINQTSGTGITRGIYIVPTLTAAADWRSIEWSNNSGWGLYGAGTADNYLEGNLGIGITPTVRLHVSGDTILRGSGATSATTALTVQNSSSTNLLTVRNDGRVTLSNDIVAGVYRGPVGTNAFMNFTSTSHLDIYPSNGIILRGAAFFIGDTTSSFPSIRRSSADLIVNDGTNGFNSSLGIGVTTVNSSAKLQIDSTTKGFLPPRMTTTEKNAIATPAAGLVVYDTTDNKHYGYDGTTWNAFY